MKEQLLDYLRAHANRSGLVLVRESRLIPELRTSREALITALTALEADGTVRILSRLPCAVLALNPSSWSSSNSSHVKKKQQISSSAAIPHIEVPVSSRAAAATHTEDGGAGEGERLLGEVLRILGPTADRDEFEAILAGKSPSLVRRCLKRVQATRNIRVSRAALFRSLLTKLS